MLISRAEQGGLAAVGQNVGVRKLVVGAISAVAAVAIAAVGAEFSAALYAQYRVARAVGSEAKLNFDPWVGIIGFPFISQARGRHYSQIEIRANGVDHPVAGNVSYEATLYSIDVPEHPWLVDASTKLAVAKLESRTIIDSPHLGRFMGIPDLLVETPLKEA